MAKKYEKPGQPTKYTKTLADKICKLISTNSRGLTTLIKENNLPDRQTIYNWLNTYAEFFDSYMQAKRDQAHVLADELSSILECGFSEPGGVEDVVAELLLCLEGADKEAIAQTHAMFSLGYFYEKNGQIKQSIDYYRKAFDIGRAKGLWNPQHHASEQLSELYAGLDEQDSTIKYLLIIRLLLIQ